MVTLKLPLFLNRQKGDVNLLPKKVGRRHGVLLKKKLFCPNRQTNYDVDHINRQTGYKYVYKEGLLLLLSNIQVVLFFSKQLRATRQNGQNEQVYVLLKVVHIPDCHLLNLLVGSRKNNYTVTAYEHTTACVRRCLYNVLVL